MINRAFFIENARLLLFGGNLRASQREGLDGILAEWERNHASKDDRWLAYMLATVHHETDRTVRPIHEYGNNAYFIRRYDVRGERPNTARQNGNTNPGDGPRYCGRGFVQLTWKNNYRAMGDVVGVDLVADPDRAMELPIATKILFYGMMHGSFTGKRLADYFDGALADWVKARKIINGLDKANLIAGYAKQYYSCISYTTD